MAHKPKDVNPPDKPGFTYLSLSNDTTTSLQQLHDYRVAGWQLDAIYIDPAGGNRVAVMEYGYIS